MATIKIDVTKTIGISADGRKTNGEKSGVIKKPK